MQNNRLPLLLGVLILMVAAVGGWYLNGIYNWIPGTYPISTTVGMNGSITPEGIVDVKKGATQTFSIVPAPGFKIVSFSIDTASTTATSTYTFTDVRTAHEIKVEFAAINYTVVGDEVYFKDSIAAGVDALSFKVLGPDHGKDRRGVFYSDGERIAQADPETFKVIEGGMNEFGMDATFVFWATERITDVDLPSFRVLNDFYSLDKNHVYYTSEKIEGADPQSFALVGEGYAKDKTKVYFQGREFQGGLPVLLGHGYATNAEGVFYYGFPVEGADAASFKPLGQNYAKDASSLFFQNSRMSNADLDSFEVVPSGFEWVSLARDTNSFYWEDEKLDLLNPNRTRLLGDYFLTDGQYVYFGSQLLTEADASTFTFLGGAFGVDKNGLWAGFTFVEGASKGGTYTYLGDLFATDGISVFSLDTSIPGADPQTFRTISGSYYSYDKNAVYYGRERIATSSVEFKILGTPGGYAKTSTEVFFGGVKVEGADAATFLPGADESSAADKNRQYYQGKAL